MKRLSQSVDQMAEHYDVVVVGSGYGAGVAASRLSRTGKSIAVLERGREFLAGDFPDDLTHGAGEFQVDAPEGHVGSATALFDFHLNSDIDVVVGCGLGGTSLINANVALVPEPRIFDNPHWPAGIRAHRDTLLEDGYKRAKAMLEPNPYPESSPTLAKLEGLKEQGEKLGRPVHRVPINVTFEDRENSAGVAQKACVLCGDCVSGCNHWAKNTVNLNYIADAHNHGVAVFCEVSVRYVARDGERWQVYYRSAGQDGDDRCVTADVVVLGAGTLGSTEILLRSAANGLPLSGQLGHRFSANGDFLGFAYNGNKTMHGIGFGKRNPADMDPVGPTITGAIWYSPDQKLEDDYIIEEGAVPGMLSPVLPGAFAAAAVAFGQNTANSITEKLRQAGRTTESLVAGAYHGATENTQTFLVIGNDDSGGVMKLEDDRLRIDWPGVGEQDYYKNIQSSLVGATSAQDGIYVKEPTWIDLLRHNLITVHPLGGCVMAESAESGTINHKNQVFSTATGDDVHDGLYVTCGSGIPCSLGVNPLFTISAVAERAMTLLIHDRGWSESDE